MNTAILDISKRTTAELLSIQMGLSCQETGLVENVLGRYGSLAELYRVPADVLQRTTGLSRSAIFRLHVATEVMRRALADRLVERDALSSPQAVETFLQHHLFNSRRERFVVIHLNAHNRVLDTQDLFLGTVDAASVYPREVVASALACNAVSLIVAHNHPSGASEPSQADHKVTQKLKSALALFDIQLLDHLVLGQGQIFSFAKAGFL
jgi:DNA repair protein RadC